jgi:hypothetical protein
VKRRYTAAMGGIVGLTAWSFAACACAQVSVDRMTCAAAVHAVQATHSYDKKTAFGVVPIMPVIPKGPGESVNCPARFIPSFFIERTLDNPACVVGYSCVERTRLR